MRGRSDDPKSCAAVASALIAGVSPGSSAFTPESGSDETPGRSFQDAYAA